MTKYLSGIIILLMIIFALYFCKKEKDLIDPIQIQYSLKHVSKYGGNDGAIDLTVSGGINPYLFQWSTNDTTEDIDNLEAGKYFVIVIDSRNISRSDTFIITQPNPDSLTVHIIGQNVTEYAGNDGIAAAVVSGGAEPYQYNWSNGSESKEITGLVSGMYYVTIIDALESQVSDSVFISQPGKYDIVIKFQIAPPSETGANDGSIIASIIGGYPPYSILWSNGSTNEEIENLEAGEYILTVTDSEFQIKVETFILSDSLIDIDGNAYAIKIIGDQTWMKSNLSVTHNFEGNSITSYTYNNDISNVKQYGRLYTWDDAMNGSIDEESQGICPCGWHIPSDEEFKELEIFLGMTQDEADIENEWRGQDVGTSLKNGGNSGYDAQLSGRRSSSGQFSLLGSFEYAWTSTEYGDNAWRRCLDVNSNEVGRWNTFPKTYAFSVRCIKDK